VQPLASPREDALADSARGDSGRLPGNASKLARLYAATGLLVAVGVPFLIGAALLHATLAPSRGYSWSRPLRILFDVARGAFFPTSAAVVFLLGEASRLDRDRIAHVVRALRSHVDLSPHRGPIVSSALSGLALLAMGAMNGQYALADYFALAGLGAVIGYRRPSRPVLLRWAIELGFVLLLFSAVSYSFTVFKAFLFYFREPKDASIVLVEHFLFRVSPHRLVTAWAAEHLWVVPLSDWVYYLLFNHMALVSIFLTGTRRSEDRKQFIASLALCYVMGGIAYYAWPGLGPGYFEPNAYEYLDRMPLATNVFRRLLYRNTTALARGAPGPIQTYEYVACMPSLHMAHEFVMLYFARRSRPFFVLSLAFTSFTLLAIVILGWHYPIDALFGAGLAGLAIAVARWQRGRLFPAHVGAGSAELGAVRAHLD
jgi:PAP2 superfamily